MGERKVLNYYIPYDFDASIIPKGARDRSKPIEVRTMLAFSIQCNTCHEYMYRGKKFNAKCERIENESYLGIKKFRFYIKCSVCSAEIIFKTDPQNSDYEMESGATRNFELWRDTAEQVAALDKEKVDQEKNDSMKALENRTLDSKIEMDVLDALDEVRAQNKRHEKVDTNLLLKSLSTAKDNRDGNTTLAPSQLNADGLTEEDEEMLQLFRQKRRKLGGGIGESSVIGEVEVAADAPTLSSFSSSVSSINNVKDVPVSANASSVVSAKFDQNIALLKKNNVVLVKKKRAGDVTTCATAKPLIAPAPVPTPSVAPVPAAKGILPLGDYGSDSD